MNATLGWNQVPAEPIRRYIEHLLSKEEGDEDSSREKICLAIWGDAGHNSPGYRKLYRLLDRREGYLSRVCSKTGRQKRESHTQVGIDFDVADHILCKLNAVHLWHEDPELSEAYLNINLRLIDIRRPTSEKTEALAGRYFMMLHRELGHGRHRSVGKHLGMGNSTVLDLRKKFSSAA